MARLLVADDDGVTRDLVARSLTADGHTIVTAADGQEALDLVEAAATAPFALLIVDVDMPLVDGIEVVRRVSAARPGTKALLMSGHAEGQVRVSALQAAGAVSYMAKPFSMEALRAAVRTLIG
ncbi:MAG: response regulator transcription factor [Hyphomicrobiaceae bacterium]|jgi:CheY-like chemotaxis protein